MKKNYLLLFITCLFFFSCMKIYSNEDQISMNNRSGLNKYHRPTTGERLDQIEQKLNNLQIALEKNQLSNECPNNLGPFVSADILFLRGQNAGWVYGFYVDNTEFTAQHIRYDWDLGCNVKLGYNVPYDFWDVLLNWTFYHNTTKDVRHYEATDTKYFRTYNASRETFRKTDSRWDLKYHTIDADLGRSFYASKALSLRPHIGIQGGFFYQKFTTLYREPVSTSTSRTSTTYDVDVVGKNYFEGVGPELGFDTNWHLGLGFSIYGNISSSLLFGKTKATFYLTAYDDDSTDITCKVRVKDLIPTLHMALGLGWGTCFYNNSMFIHLHCGWQCDHIWDSCYVPSSYATFIYNTTDYKSLALEGLSAGFKLEF